MGAPTESLERELARHVLIEELDKSKQNIALQKMLDALPRDIDIRKSKVVLGNYYPHKPSNTMFVLQRYLTHEVIPDIV